MIRRSADIPPPLFALARAQGERAAARCEAKAESDGFDSAGAGAFILDLVRRQGPCSGEFCVNQAKAAGFAPHDDRAFGSVFQSLARKGLIRCAGFTLREKGHSTAGGRLWRAA